MATVAAVKNRDKGITLVQAAKAGEADAVSSALKNGADVNYIDKDGWSALLGAACEGHADIALQLVHAKANVNEQFKFGKTALHWAAHWGRLELQQALLDAGADVNQRDGDGRTPIMCAAFQDQTEAGQALIQAGADLTIKEYKYGWTVLHAATRYGRMDLVEILLDAGCDVNVLDNKRWTPLIYASEQGHTQAVLALMAHGADVNAQTADGYTALHFTRRADIAGMLLDAEADPNIKNKEGNTPLHCAAKDGFTEVVRKLVDYGADKNMTNSKGKTAIMVTTFDKVKEVLSGHVSSGARGGGGRGAYIPRYARGTANVAAAPVNFGVSAPAAKPKLGATINTSDHHSHHVSSAAPTSTTPTSTSTSHSPVPPAAAKPTPAPAPVTPTPVAATTAAPRPMPAAAVTTPAPVKPATQPAPAPAAAVSQPPPQQQQHAPEPAKPTPAPAVAPVPAAAVPAASSPAKPAPAAEPEPDINTLVKEALKAGTKEWRRSKLSIVGEGRAGKTALTNAIIGRGFLDTSSTVGINQLTCDVRQIKASGQGQEQTDWTEAKKADRELETALAHAVARRKRRLRAGQSAHHHHDSGSVLDFLKEQDEERGGRVDGDLVQEHLFKTAASPAALLPAKPSAPSAVPGGGAWAPKGAAAAAPVAGAWTPKKKTEYESASAATSFGSSSIRPTTSDPDIHGMFAGTGSLSGFRGIVQPRPTRTSFSKAGGGDASSVAVIKDEPDEKFVMKALAEIKDDDSGLLISLFDFGGQSVFDVIHHLFLTRNGVYALVFNMEWLVKEGPEKDKALRFMRNWLSSVAVHTYDKNTNTTAPIVFVGTRLDTVPNPAKHGHISTLLYEQFSDNIAWKSVLGNENGHDANGKAYHWFFPVDNKLGKKGPTMKQLMSVVHDAMEGAAYTHKEVPLTWFKVMDYMASKKKDCLLLSDVTDYCVKCQVPSDDVPYLLSFLHDMGHLMWLDEPGLRDVVILDPVSYLVTPATVVICKITPDNDDPTHHFMACHRECERLHKREWMQLKQEGVLNVALLPILWKPYLDHQAVLLQLMVKFGLLVPLRSSADVKKAQHGGTAHPVTLYLVPTLLTMAPINQGNLLVWTEAPFSTCYLVFTLSEELEQNTTINVSDLQSTGFLPGGMFERLVGKALSWSQETSKGSGINIKNVMIFKDMAVLHFGGQRFRLVHCADIHCVKVEVEGSNPLGIQQKLQDFVGRIIEECMRSLRCFTAVLYPPHSSHGHATSTKEVDSRDPLKKNLLPSELLIPLPKLREAAKGESMLSWRGGRTLMTTQEIKSGYDQWLKLYELRDRYDLFISYRWGLYDSDLTEALFDMLTNFVVGNDKRAVEVFLDKKRLQGGRRFKVDLASGLTHSLIVMPVVSVDALKRMLEHTPDSVDNVLLEWIMVLECVAAKRVMKVFPVLFGARTTDLREGGIKVGDFFADPMRNMLPQIVPRATLSECRELLLANDITPSKAFTTYTVHSVVNEMMQFLLIKANDYSPSQIVEVVADRVLALLHDCGQEALDLVAKDCHTDTFNPGPASPTKTSAPSPVPTAAAPAPAAAAPAAAATRPLASLNTDEICALMERTNLKMLVDIFRGNGMTGELLEGCEKWEELQDSAYGVSSAGVARTLMKRIDEWKKGGVPM